MRVFSRVLVACILYVFVVIDRVCFCCFGLVVGVAFIVCVCVCCCVLAKLLLFACHAVIVCLMYCRVSSVRADV